MTQGDGVGGWQREAPMKRIAWLCAAGALLCSVGQAESQSPAQGACAPANIACQCSFQCCGEERCDGSICSQCVIDCVQRQQTVDKRALSLKSRCQSLMTRGFKRL
jgi:hypothetical protein